MLIHEKGPFVRGSILLISFLVLFCVLLTPIMRDEKGNHLTGLQYADNVFNELSKGSSYFIPSVREHVKTVEKVNVKVTVTMKKAELAETAVQVLTKAGMTASADGAKVSYEGNLAAMRRHHRRRQPVPQRRRHRERPLRRHPCPQGRRGLVVCAEPLHQGTAEAAPDRRGPGR